MFFTFSFTADSEDNTSINLFYNTAFAISKVDAIARSRGVKINKLFEQYNGGGHVYACGAKLHGFNEADEIIDKLDELCKEYKEEDL